jgi:hypothetical protein
MNVYSGWGYLDIWNIAISNEQGLEQFLTSVRHFAFVKILWPPFY